VTVFTEQFPRITSSQQVRNLSPTCIKSLACWRHLLRGSWRLRGNVCYEEVTRRKLLSWNSAFAEQRHGAAGTLRRCKRCGYCSSDLPDFEELLDESDHRLFCKILNNSTHTLHKLLPPQSTASQHYHLRRRTHDRQLPTQTSHLCNKNFVTRTLYKDCY